jgi:hypothetical protein
MIEPEGWNDVLGSITGTIYRGTERISSNRLLDLSYASLAGMDLAHCGLAVLLPSGAIGACHTLSRPTSPEIAKVLTAPFDPSDANLTRS